jgi:uncharacterized C2H2 Zn-finger protein
MRFGDEAMLPEKCHHGKKFKGEECPECEKVFDEHTMPQREKTVRENATLALDKLNDATYCFNRGEPGGERLVSEARVLLRAALFPNSVIARMQGHNV